ncbi:MAG: hypothetical protein HN347_16215 [Bacteroidetes bacterium]|nr:hypothetical protein [Bacteroidota bacterium]
MDIDKFNSLITTEKSTWMDDYKRRKRWRWLNKLTLKPRIKYYRIKRIFLLFLHGVVKAKRTFSYCQREIEGNKMCKEQCDHCKEYYAPLEGNK